MATKDQYAVAVVDETTPEKVQITFTGGTLTSDVFYCRGTSLVGLYLPSGWVTANISFQVSKTPNGNFVSVLNFDGTDLSIQQVPNDSFLPLQPSMFNSILYVKVVSSETQTNIALEASLAPIFQGLHG